LQGSKLKVGFGVPCPGKLFRFPFRCWFAWQEKYGTFNVSVSQLDKAIESIKGQEEHHRKMTFQEEFLVPLCGIEKTPHRT
jgi:hypothetical protein